MNTNIKIKATRSVYQFKDVTYTPYINDKGEIWLACEGNGCGDDEQLFDLDGMDDSDVWEHYCEFDTDAMRGFADEVEAAGDADNADWIRGWCDRVERIQAGEPVDAETRECVLSVMRNHDMGEVEDIDADDKITEVWSDGRSQLYRIDAITTLYLLDGSGEPTLFDNLATAHNQVMF